MTYIDISMKNTVNQVWDFIDNHPCIKKDSERNLINVRALAKYIITTTKIDATIDAVISAIRRYELGKSDDQFVIARDLISHTLNLSTRSGLAEITIVKNDEIQRSLPLMFDIIDYNRGEILRIIQATQSIKLLVDEKNIENITALFPKYGITKVEKNLAEINMHMHPKMIITHGILAVIANELTINGINIVEIVSCLPEMVLIVKDDDILKAYKILYNLCRKE